MQIIVNTTQAQALFGGKAYKCASGKGGAVSAEDKTEGDGATPLGQWRLRRIFYRPDRIAPPKSNLPLVPLRPTDGWCDAPLDPLYNRPVSLPYPSSHEKLWREDHVYDVIVELGHNDDPVIPYRGSAVFMHVAKTDYTPTEGCIALALDDLLDLLSRVEVNTIMDIRPA
ncbi:MAG: L,D-transpeptidase family protein [Hyphomonadaceae bacterium]